MGDAAQVRGFQGTVAGFGRTNPVTLPENIAILGIAVLAVVVVAALGFLLHLPLSAAEPLELVVVLLVALRRGLLQASITSLVAVLCLDYLFTQPLFTFTVSDPQNWISLITFEISALFVSKLSSKVRSHAARVDQQQRRAMSLYELSRALLYVQEQRPIADQLSPLIRELAGVEGVAFWMKMEGGSTDPRSPLSGLVQAAYEACTEERNLDDIPNRRSSRTLRLGVTVIGGMALEGWEPDPFIADAIASLAALAFERSRANRQESRAEIARDAEQLRTAVLDGLAHSFKTPLTAIQTASSGLLAVGQLTAMQTELVSIIDDRATMLAQLTTQLLQTAALDAKQIRLHRTTVSLTDLIDNVVRERDEEVQQRITLHIPLGLDGDDVDAPLFELALQQLVDNAAKYSAPRTVIDVTVEQGRWETVVAVSNVGRVGFSIRPDETTKIFERFYRGTRSEYGPAGTGLGLSVVQKIAEAHGGRAWVECRDETATFHLGIPRRRGGKHG